MREEHFKSIVAQFNAALHVAQQRGMTMLYLKMPGHQKELALRLAADWDTVDAPLAVTSHATERHQHIHLYFLLDMFQQPTATTNKFNFAADSYVHYRSSAWRRQVLPYAANVLAFPIRVGFVPPPKLATTDTAKPQPRRWCRPKTRKRPVPKIPPHLLGTHTTFARRAR